MITQEEALEILKNVYHWERESDEVECRKTTKKREITVMRFFPLDTIKEIRIVESEE